MFKLANRIIPDKIIFTGFSLVEMLMALLVASLLMAALAPVMTKRVDGTLEVDNASTPGLRVWAEPGNYTFTVPSDVQYLNIQGAGGGGGGGGASVKQIGPMQISNGNFTVPKGVSKITFTLIGAGGSGGTGNGKTLNASCDSLILPAFSDSGKDLCVSNTIPYGWAYLQVAKPDETAAAGVSCWVPDYEDETSRTSYSCDDASKPVASKYFTGGGCKKPLCTRAGASMWCSTRGGGRMITASEMKRIVEASTPANNYKYLFGEGLDLAIHKYSGSNGIYGNINVTQGNEAPGLCNSSAGHYVCHAYSLFLDDGYASFTSNGTTVNNELAKEFQYAASQVRCARELNNWNSFAGAGGSSGAKLTKTIDVNPGDIINFTIAEKPAQSTVGGAPSNYSGKESCAIHTNNTNNTVTKYCAEGGIGGNGASSTANGGANTARAKCYMQKTGMTTVNISENCTLAVNENNGLGYAPKDTATGGTGAGGALGGGLDTNNGEGESASNTQYGYGGGGGACKRGVRSADLCSKGGSGGRGYGEISYNIISPGGGGGAGGAVGNSEYLKLKVTPKDIIYITVGAGGNGGQNASFATKGGNSKITTNEGKKSIEFEGGFGGNPGSFTGEGLNTVQNAGTGGAGGKYPNNSFELTSPEEKTSGKQGGTNGTGYDGGQGGETRLGTAGACGGKQKDENVCDNGLINGLDGTLHNIISNKYGGAGGGGGGSDGTLQGTGGEGGAGYVRIKWETNK